MVKPTEEFNTIRNGFIIIIITAIIILSIISSFLKVKENRATIYYKDEETKTEYNIQIKDSKEIEDIINYISTKGQ